jgi:Fe-S-cluster-containing dehydrogenase component/formate-dependent nitrite reductase membrane component NrfD
VACKSEHQVPIGVNRTWVKYIEKGEFPNSRRLFSVMRCNHCDNAPCIEICPVTALFRRSDGIVDFDGRRCIGCKACMQACPYDALYIDPESHTAAKCNYCARRIDNRMEPACVIVCPTQAIISGDLDDPQSTISQMKGRHQVVARKSEKGTRPKLFYIEGDNDSLDPQATTHADNYMWGGQSSGVGHFASDVEHALDRLGQLLSLGESSRMLAKPLRGSVERAAKIVDLLAAEPRRAYDAPQKGILWGWQVSSYLWTKGIAAGICAVPLLAVTFGIVAVSASYQILAVIIALAFVSLTGILLVLDLDQPKRFFYVLLRPQWRSWLVRGAYILALYGALLVLYGLAVGWGVNGLKLFLTWPLLIAAIMTAVYTAFLFAQAKGRDAWQSSALPFHMLFHSFLCGGAVFCLTTVFHVAPAAWISYLRFSLIAAAILQVSLQSFELFLTHPTVAAREVAHSISRGRYASIFWLSNGLLIIALVLLAWGVLPRLTLPVAGIFILLGVFLGQHILVRAPQQVPLS